MRQFSKGIGTSLVHEDNLLLEGNRFHKGYSSRTETKILAGAVVCAFYIHNHGSAVFQLLFDALSIGKGRRRGSFNRFKIGVFSEPVFKYSSVPANSQYGNCAVFEVL